MLVCEDVNSSYGPAQILFGISLRDKSGNCDLPPWPQWRRKDNNVALYHGTGSPFIGTHSFVR